MTTTTQQAAARARGSRNHAATYTSGNPARTRTKAHQAQRLAECVAELQRVVTALYGAGAPIPPSEGGLLFREVAEGLQRRRYAITEAQLSAGAVKLGLWRDSVRAVVEAVRPGGGTEDERRRRGDERLG